MKSIVIVGGSGFIGQNLQRSFKQLYEINAISLRQENWMSKTTHTDVIINLVGKAHDHKGTGTEQDYYYANFELTKSIFKAFIQSDAKLLIHVSSLASLEEFESDRPLLENDTPKPQSFYGKSKRKAEEWLMNQNLPQNKRIIILRPPMVHGPGDKGNLGLLYKLISRGIPYPLSSFKNERSFINIDNFSFFIKEIINGFDKLETGIYHISDDESVSTNEIIEIIKTVERKKVINLTLPKSIVITLAKIGDIIPFPLNTKRLKKMTSNLIVSNHKIKSALGIDKLPLTAQEGLIKTIESFKNK